MVLTPLINATRQEYRAADRLDAVKRLRAAGMATDQDVAEAGAAAYAVAREVNDILRQILAA